jgi:hypothetical protein
MFVVFSIVTCYTLFSTRTILHESKADRNIEFGPSSRFLSYKGITLAGVA